MWNSREKCRRDSGGFSWRLPVFEFRDVERRRSWTRSRRRLGTWPLSFHDKGKRGCSAFCIIRRSRYGVANELLNELTVLAEPAEAEINAAWRASFRANFVLEASTFIWKRFDLEKWMNFAIDREFWLFVRKIIDSEILRKYAKNM